MFLSRLDSHRGCVKSCRCGQLSAICCSTRPGLLIGKAGDGEAVVKQPDQTPLHARVGVSMCQCPISCAWTARVLAVVVYLVATIRSVSGILKELAGDDVPT